MLKRKEFKNEDLFEQYLEKVIQRSVVKKLGGDMQIIYAGETIYPSDDPGLSLLQREIETKDHLYLVADRKWKMCQMYKEEIDD